MDWLLTNGTVIDVLSIGEEALDEERLLYVRRRVVLDDLLSVCITCNSNYRVGILNGH